jgi:hypothetical protein
MEFLLNHKCRKTAEPSFGIISDLDMIQIYQTKNDITVREAAQYLMNIKNPQPARRLWWRISAMI